MSKYIPTSEIRKRGWTDQMIENHLVAKFIVKPAPGLRRYLRCDVIAVEQIPERAAEIKAQLAAREAAEESTNEQRSEGDEEE